MAVLIGTDAEGNAESEMINFPVLRATIVGGFLIDYSRRTLAAASFLTRRVFFLPFFNNAFRHAYLGQWDKDARCR